MSIQIRNEVVSKVHLYCRFNREKAVIFFNNDGIKLIINRSDSKKVAMKTAIESIVYKCNTKYTIEIDQDGIASISSGCLSQQEVFDKMQFVAHNISCT